MTVSPNGGTRRLRIPWKLPSWSLVERLSHEYHRVVRLKELPFKGDTSFYEGEIIELRDRWKMKQV
jgi:hypothetical protein